MLGTNVSDLNQVLVVGWLRSGYYAGRERCHIRNKLRNVNSLHDGKERSKAASATPTLSIAIVAKRAFRELLVTADSAAEVKVGELDSIPRSRKLSDSGVSPLSTHRLQCRSDDGAQPYQIALR